MVIHVSSRHKTVFPVRIIEKYSPDRMRQEGHCCRKSKHLYVVELCLTSSQEYFLKVSSLNLLHVYYVGLSRSRTQRTHINNETNNVAELNLHCTSERFLRLCTSSSAPKCKDSFPVAPSSLSQRTGPLSEGNMRQELKIT